jgi:hypothetical protein
MGDLCSHINVLYDEAILNDFNESGCPYSVSNKRITTMKVKPKKPEDVTV